MSFLLFKYGLPTLLGYILFLGISGRFLPLSVPKQRAARPAWFFGLWAGAAVSLVLGVTLHIAYQLPTEEAKALLLPSLLLLAGILLPGCVGYRMLQRDVRLAKAESAEIEQQLDVHQLDSLFESDEYRLDATLQIGLVDDYNRVDNWVNRNDLSTFTPEFNNPDTIEQKKAA